MGKLAKIQATLIAPKGQYNSFGKYHYRSCEDILEAVKPLLDGATLTISDEMVEVGGRVYVKATATFIDGVISHSTTAYAREQEERKGMDAAQITGAASSYARKYCLNGLFLIDDTKDADTSNNTPLAKVETQQKHWCAEHNTAFFKRGKMNSYAHPIEGTKKDGKSLWCYEHSQPKPEEAQAEEEQSSTAEEFEKLGGKGGSSPAQEFTASCAKPPLSIVPSQIKEALDIKEITDIEDFDKAYQKLLGIFDKA